MRKYHFLEIFQDIAQRFPLLPFLQTARDFKNVNDADKKQGWEEESRFYVLSAVKSSSSPGLDLSMTPVQQCLVMDLWDMSGS